MASVKAGTALVPLASILESDDDMPTPYVYDCSLLVKSGRQVRVLSNGWTAWPWPQAYTSLVHTWEEARRTYRGWPHSHQVRIRYLRPGSPRDMGFAGSTLAVEDLMVPGDYLNREPLKLPGIPSVLFLERPHTRSSVTPFCVRGVAIRGLDILEIETAWVTGSVLPYRLAGAYSQDTVLVQRFDPFSIRLVTEAEARRASAANMSVHDLLAWWEERPSLLRFLADLRVQRGEAASAA